MELVAPVVAGGGVKMESEGMRKNSTLICVPLMADSVDQMLIYMNKAKLNGADLVEVRLDSLKSFNPPLDIETLIKRCPLPTLFTYRPKWEGGMYDGDESSRLEALQLAMELGADYIDVELQVIHEFNSSMHGKKPAKCKLIVSSHNYENTPSVEDIGNLVVKIQATGADIVKIATTALDITDAARVFQITVHSQVRGVPIIAMVMGERGLMARILCPKFGGYLTFGTLESGIVSAPGQPTMDDLVNLYNIRQIGPDTKVFGIIGKPVGHSKSPILYNEAFKKVGFNGVYLHLLVDDVANFLQTYSSTDFAGFSCTIPHKEAALKCCDEVDPVAKVKSDGKFFGCNTDYVGAITAIEDALGGLQHVNGMVVSPLAGKLFVVIGAGGAGKALAYGAKAKGAKVVIANRTYERAKEIADTIGGDALSLADLSNFHPEDGMILANTTSIGMQPKVDETPVPKQALKSYALVFDAVYTPKITRLLREAEESGAKIVTGVEMFIGQAYEQFERFTGLPGAVWENHGKILIKKENPWWFRFCLACVKELEAWRITSKIKALGRLGRIACARKLFDEMPCRDSVAWNAMLSSYSQLGLYREAVLLFHHMRDSGTKPDSFSFTATLSACAGAFELLYGEKIHAQVIVLGYNSSLPVNNSLIDMYGKCLSPSSANRVFEEMGTQNDVSWCSILFAYTNAGQFDIACGVFDTMPKRVYIAWNTMIAGYAQCGKIESCFDLFRRMLESCCGPDQWTLSALMNACAKSEECFHGFMMHAFVVKSGWSSAVEANNSILSFYAKVGCQEDVVKVYESIGTLSQVSWNAIIDAHMKIGDTHKAFIVFQLAPEKNIVSWTSMITGYARNGLEEQALSFFVDVMRGGLKPDGFTFGAVLHACSNLATLKHGKMVHGCVIHYGFHAYTYVGNGLINMYAKCGDIGGSNQAFNGIIDKDLVSWNALLIAFGLHGQASQALQLYEEMGECGLRPDKVTFIGLLMTCSHSGLVEKGRALFESMSSVYGLFPEMDHVACVVDMLGRGGYLEEARELANKYLGTDRASIISREALFGACFAHADTEMGTQLGGDLKLLEPRNEMSYVLLSNLYCASGQWKEAEVVRKAMIDQGVKKMPGCSWIEVKNKVIAFVAGRHSNPHMKELHEMLYFFEQEMRNPCYAGSR
ncbi:unnamed protein product [Camellia sinensis]